MSDEPNTVELESLVGKHTLTAVGSGTESIKDWGDRFEDCQSLTFTLDGVTYSAVEDPDDGYRSSMRYLKVTDARPEYAITPHEVIATMRGKDEYGDDNDVMDFADAVTGKVVLSVGTLRIDDYYPAFVAEWTPQNLAANAR